MRNRYLTFLAALAFACLPRLAAAQCTVNITASTQSICAGDSSVLSATLPSTLLQSTLAGGNNHRGNMFNITAINTITITSFDGHPMGNTDYIIYYKTGTHVGFETNSAAWTLVGSATGVVAQPFGTPTPLPIPVNITIPAGQTYAFYISSTNTAVSQNYTNGTAVGNVYASNADLQFIEGTGQEYPFGSTFSPRIWNGRIHYSSGANLLWSTGATSSSITVMPSSTTTYSCTLNIPLQSCSVTDTLTVSVSQQPSVNLGPDTSACGLTVLDAGNSGATYLWSNGDTTQTTSALSSNTYAVTVTNASGCVGSDAVALTINTPPTQNLPGDSLLCPGFNWTLDAGNPGSTYSWSNGASTQTSTFSSLDAGPVTVTVTSPEGCQTTDTLLILATSGSLDLGPDTSVCDGATFLLDGGASNIAWFWNTTDTSQTILGVGGFSYTVAATTADGCTLQDTIILSLQAPPSASFNAVPAGLSVACTNSSANASTFLWVFGDGNTSTLANPTHTYGTDGSYTITLIASNPCGSDTTTFSLTVVGMGDVFGANLQVSPNPSNGSFRLQGTLEGSHPAVVEVYSLTGASLYRAELPASLQLSHSLSVQAAPGIYLLQVSEGSRRATQRIVIQ